MKAIIYHKSKAILEEIPLPTTKYRQVRIKVAYSGLCRTDQYAAKGKIQVTEGRVLGHEFSGTIDERHPTCLQDRKQGKKVSVMPIFKDSKNRYSNKMLGIDTNGSFAEYICVDETMVFPLQNDYDLQLAAFLEPICACLAICNIPTKKHASGAIQGTSRLAILCKLLMEYYGWNIKLLSDNVTKKASLDYIIETSLAGHEAKEIISLIKEGGHLILKSRPHNQIDLPLKTIVEKEITMIGKYYGDFETCIQIAPKVPGIFDIFGEVVSFEKFLPILNNGNELHTPQKIFLDPTIDNDLSSKESFSSGKKDTYMRNSIYTK